MEQVEEFGGLFPPAQITSLDGNCDESSEEDQEEEEGLSDSDTVSWDYLDYYLVGRLSYDFDKVSMTD